MITVAAVCLILGPSPPPALPEEVYLYTEDKIRRWSLGKLTLARESILFKLAVLDWLGSAMMLGLITCLLMALQWGGVK